MLLWTCEIVAQRKGMNMLESYEGWYYRKGFMRQLQRLEHRSRLIRSHRTDRGRIYRLTGEGLRRASGERDPLDCWRRPWDGLWRMVVFDVPEIERKARDQLRRTLKTGGFGYLQHSVWISPHPLDLLDGQFSRKDIDVQAVTILNAQPCSGVTNQDLVAGAWNFKEINARYARYKAHLLTRPSANHSRENGLECLAGWLREERQLWIEALMHDPLLPECLLPGGYQGSGAWQLRQTAIQLTRREVGSHRGPL